MRSPCRIPALLLGLAACGGPPAVAQPTPPPPSDPLAHAYVYEVPSGQQTPQTTPSQQTPATIQVTGTATVSLPADVARVSFAVETREKEAGAASAANAELMSRVIAALQKAALPGLHIETYGYALNPEYAVPTPQTNRTRVIAGYVALNNIRVTLTDVQAVGKAMDTAIGAGANRVSSLSFAASETADARREALSRAVAEARGEAEAIAAALGHELGPPLEINGGAQIPQPVGPMMFAEAARGAAATPVEPGEQKVTASVTIRFALGPEKPAR
jgi:uncharacterized protein YggE